MFINNYIYIYKEKTREREREKDQKKEIKNKRKIDQKIICGWIDRSDKIRLDLVRLAGWKDGWIDR